MFAQSDKANPCRLSYDCVVYTDASEDWSGYLKNEPVPLLYFIHTPGSATEKSYCSGHYKDEHGYYGTATNEIECARQCLSNSKCVQFMFAQSDHADPCRLSYDCVEYTDVSEEWSGYLRVF